MITRTSKLPNRLFVISFVVLCGAASVAGWSLSARFSQGEQRRQRVIDKIFTRSAPVVEIEEVKVSQNTVKLGSSFEEDNDWPGKVFLKVKNVSSKPIIYLQVNINFPETRAMGSMMSYPVVFGQMPGSRFPQKEDPIFMMPGDIMEIPLDKRYAKIKSFVEQRTPMSNICKLELEIGFVIFADKTAWVAGEYKVQDPNDPDRYIPVGPIPPQ